MPKGDKLTMKQKKFCEKYVDSWNGTQAALEVYDTDNPRVAQTIASENLSKPLIKEFLEEHVQHAKSMIYILSQTAEKEETRLKASQDIVDRVEGKATQNINNKLSGNLNVVSLDDIIE